MRGTLEKAWGYQGETMNLPVQDVAAALPFYEHVLGFRLLSRSDTPHKSVVLARDQVQIGLAENGGDSSQDGCAFHVKDLAALFAEFKANGLDKQLAEFDTEMHGDIPWKVFYVVAPDGLCYWFGERQAGAMPTLYEAVGGGDALLKLASAWHTRVLEDEVVSHAFKHGYHPQHTERLAAYWAEALGGPTTYSDRYGDETSVVRIHSGNGLHEEMDQRAIACFDRALEDVGLARDERLRQVLHDYFAWATTTAMARYHESADEVPRGLHIPKWSWQGLVSGGGSDDDV